MAEPDPNNLYILERINPFEVHINLFTTKRINCRKLVWCYHCKQYMWLYGRVDVDGMDMEKDSPILFPTIRKKITKEEAVEVIKASHQIASGIECTDCENYERKEEHLPPIGIIDITEHVL